MREPLITICLGVRNWHARHLLYCLRSLDLLYMPTIVVDGEPSQRVEEMVGLHGKLYVPDPVDVWSRAVALNTAVQHAKTPWLCFTDADMLFAQNWRDVAEAAIERASSMLAAPMSLTHSRDLSQDATRILHTRASQWDDETLSLLTTPHPNVGQGGGMLVNRAWFERVGGFDEFYTVWGCEDNDLVMRALWDGAEVEWLQDTFVAHQWHPRDATPAQMDVLVKNRHYLAQRMDEGGPIVRNARVAQQP